jgi:hypothetical protein
VRRTDGLGLVRAALAQTRGSRSLREVGYSSKSPSGGILAPVPVRGVRWPAGRAEGGGEMKLDLQTVALVAIAVALWVAVFQGFNAF